MSKLLSHAPPRFLHLKFGDGRPPEFATQHKFAHQIAVLGPVGLPEGLRTDVQRDGLARYLTNNFKDGSPVHVVVTEREGDEGSYVLLTANWHRSAGDGVRDSVAKSSGLRRKSYRAAIDPISTWGRPGWTGGDLGQSLLLGHTGRTSADIYLQVRYVDAITVVGQKKDQEARRTTCSETDVCRPSFDFLDARRES